MIEIKTDISQDDWNEFVSARPEANFLHSYEWGEFHAARGKKVLRAGLYKDSVLLGAVTGQVEDARRGRYLAVAGGPIIDWTDGELVGRAFECIKDFAVQNKCVFVRIRPQLESTSQHTSVFKHNNYKPAPMSLSVEHAGILDISKPEEDIMAGMSQSLRRKIRKAQKQNITIRVSDDAADLETFYSIHADHAERQAYVAFTKDFLFKQFEVFKQAGKVKIYTAEHDGRVIAQNFMIFYGNEVSYHYGVSTSEGVKLSSAPLLHLRAMQDAREANITRYNFWGIVPEGATSHRYYGVSQFKRSFGVQDLEYLPAQDLVLKKFPYLKNWLIETARKKIRKL